MSKTRESILEPIGSTQVVRINNTALKGVELFVKLEAIDPMGSLKPRLTVVETTGGTPVSVWQRSVPRWAIGRLSSWPTVSASSAVN